MAAAANTIRGQQSRRRGKRKGGERLRQRKMKTNATGNTRHKQNNKQDVGNADEAIQGTESKARVVVMGDLHLSEGLLNDYFHPARADALRALDGASGGERLVVQVGDLGAYDSNPGSQACFEVAKGFLDGFKREEEGRSTTTTRVRLITGNHDLEGEEFDDPSGDASLGDAANLDAWSRTFNQHHYWREEVGSSWLLLGLSTTRFRSNANSCHEVYINDEQRQWLQRVLQENAEAPSRRKVAIFTHAPPAGCGLRVLHSVHVKNRCAWLNHSDSRSVRWFMDELVNAFSDDIMLWSSGHFHLSHEYIDSISVVGNTAFVQCGVIGPCHRDGNRYVEHVCLRENGTLCECVCMSVVFVYVVLTQSTYACMSLKLRMQTIEDVRPLGHGLSGVHN